MESFTGLNYNAVGIEHAFAMFMQQGVGERGLPHDADAFRMGEVKSLAEVIDRLADQLEARSHLIKFSSNENGSPQAKIRVAVKSLHSLATAMKTSGAEEPQDYHWLIVGDLVLAIDALLKQLGA